MQTQEFWQYRFVPYRRETFAAKKIILDFDADFNMTDANVLSNDAWAKSSGKIRTDLDSLIMNTTASDGFLQRRQDDVLSYQ